MECMIFYRKTFFKKWILALFLLGIFTANFHVKAQPGDALELDGNDDYVNFGKNFQYDDNQPFTISFWFFRDQETSKNDRLMGYRTTKEWGFLFDGGFIDGGQDIVFRFQNTELAAVTGGDFKKWYHCAVTHDGKAVKLYLNGKLANSKPQSNTWDDPSNRNLNFILGTVDDGSDVWGEYFDGKVDELRIWSESRSQNEIQDLMHQQIDHTNYSNLEGYWRFNNISGGTATDETNNNNDGNLINGPTDANSNAVMTNDTDLQNGGTFAQDVKAIWPGNDNTNQDGGLQLSNFSSSTAGEYIIVGHNGNTGENELTNNSNIQVKLDRDWKIDKNGGSISANFTFITDKAGNNGFSSVSDLSAYKFVRADGSAPDGYTVDNSGADGADADNNTITFNSLSISDAEAYSLGTEDASSAPLPVELLYFEARPNDGSAFLEWATASETNNKHFIVQKKTGQDAEWENIGRVMGHGTTTENHQYRFKDKELTKGTHYYRLKQVDFGGTFEHHPVEVLEMNEVDPFEMKVRPHHRQDLIELDMNSKKGGNYETTVINMKGHVVYQKSQNLSSGNQVLEIPMREVSPGIYIIRMQGQGTTAQKKFLIE